MGPAATDDGRPPRAWLGRGLGPGRGHPLTTIADHEQRRRLAALRIESVDALFKGRDALARKEWTNGQLILSKLLTKIEAEPRLADLRGRATDTLDQINRGLADQQALGGGSRPVSPVPPAAE